MSDHLTAPEKHDAAYGFTGPRRHCDACDRDVDALRAEREALERIFSIPMPELVPSGAEGRAPRPARRPEWRWTMIPAAAALLAALAWMLAVPTEPGPDTVTPASSQDLASRLVRELSSLSPERRAIATEVLKSMGVAGLDALRGSPDPEAIRLAKELAGGAFEFLPALERMRIEMQLEDATLEAFLDYVREFAGVNIMVDADVDLSVKVSVNARDQKASEVLRSVLHPLGLTTQVREERVLMVRKSSAARPGSAPLRLRVPAPPDAGKLILLLARSGAARDEAAARLVHPGAEEMLWTALDHKNPDIAAAAAVILRKLYAPGPLRETAGDPPAILEVRLSLDYPDGVPFSTVLARMSEWTQLTFIREPGLQDPPVVIRVKDLTLGSTLKILTRQIGAEFHVVRGRIAICKPGRIIRSAAPTSPLFWTDAASAAALSDFINRGDIERLAKAGPEALAAVRYAQKIMSADDARRLAAAVDRILDSQARDHWFIDEPAAWRRPRDLALEDEKVRKALDQFPLTFKAKDMQLSALLKLLRPLVGIPFVLEGADFRTDLDATNVPLGEVLEPIVRLAGLELRIEGGKVVVR